MHRINPRLCITKTESNVLLTQIRAERRRYPVKQPPLLTPSTRANQGKLICRQNLFQDTFHVVGCSPNVYKTLSPSRSSGKKLFTTCQVASARNDRMGKRMFGAKIYEESSPSPLRELSPKGGVRRLNRSPNYQHCHSKDFPIA